jgi:antitoxin (DNA-binding transcriptional repressor) of toxin-antitoxin stability system
MRTVNIGTLKNQLSAYLRYVKNGEEVLVRDRDMPVAKIVPVTKPNPDDNDYAAEGAYLIATGQMRPALEELDREEFWKLPRPTVSDEAVKEALDWVRGK